MFEITMHPWNFGCGQPETWQPYETQKVMCSQNNPLPSGVIQGSLYHTNPTNALFRGNPSKWPCICIKLIDSLPKWVPFNDPRHFHLGCPAIPRNVGHLTSQGTDLSSLQICRTSRNFPEIPRWCCNTAASAFATGRLFSGCNPGP